MTLVYQTQLGLVGAAQSERWDYPPETLQKWAHRKELHPYNLHLAPKQTTNPALEAAMKSTREVPVTPWTDNITGLVRQRFRFDGSTWREYAEVIDVELARLTKADPRYTFSRWPQNTSITTLGHQVIYTLFRRYKFEATSGFPTSLALQFLRIIEEKHIALDHHYQIRLKALFASANAHMAL